MHMIGWIHLGNSCESDNIYRINGFAQLNEFSDQLEIEYQNLESFEKQNKCVLSSESTSNHWAWVCPIWICFAKLNNLLFNYIKIYFPADVNLNDDDRIQSSSGDFDSIPWNIYLSIWNSYRKPSYGKYQFSVSLHFYLRTATAIQFVTTRYF